LHQQGSERVQDEINDLKTAVLTMAQNQRTLIAVAKEIGESNRSSRGERGSRKDYQKKSIS